MWRHKSLPVFFYKFHYFLFDWTRIFDIHWCIWSGEQGGCTYGCKKQQTVPGISKKVCHMRRRLFGSNPANILDLSHGGLPNWTGGYVNMTTFSVLLGTNSPADSFPDWLHSILSATVKSLGHMCLHCLYLVSCWFSQVHIQPQWLANSIVRGWVKWKP
jgi:hypothetical protein